MLQPKTYEEAELALGAAKPAWEKLIADIRTSYIMEELYTSGKSTGKLNNYCNELKFRRGGKTLVTFYLRDGFFIVSVVLGNHVRNCRDKSDTFTVEGVNADLRHYIPLLRRRNRCFARICRRL